MAKRGVVPYVPSEVEIVGALADVAYEIEQILDLASTWPTQRGLQQNAWLEATLFHTRQLLDFLEHAIRSKSQGRENDDVLAADYGFSPRQVPVPVPFRERLNKDLAHLSYSRQQRLGPSKSWDLTNLCPLLDRCREFAEHVVQARGQSLPPDQAQRWATLTDRLNGV